MGAGVPIPPVGIPRTLEGRPRRRSQGSGSTPRAYVKREASLDFSESSTSGDLPTIPTPESGFLRRRDPSAFADVTDDDEGTASI